jgi:hypothetical protein
VLCLLVVPHARAMVIATLDGGHVR